MGCMLVLATETAQGISLVGYALGQQRGKRWIKMV
jgi:hypothetical protein